MNKQTQRQKILQYCKDNGSITIRDAFEKLHINSPSKRISEMRLGGYCVEAITETRTNSDGEEVKYKRYFISDGSDGLVS
jgi:hypothetical protein